jgi:glycine cleavage system H protein
MRMIPTELKYTETHEWVHCEGNIATIGITHHAQEQLTDIVFVELPNTGAHFSKGSECTVIESCKIAAEMYAPVSGAVVATNQDLQSSPGLINEDPYGKGWIIKIEMENPSEIDSLLSADVYQEQIA